MKKLCLALLIVLSIFMFNSSTYAKSTSSSMISEKNIYVNLLVHSSGGGSHSGGAGGTSETHTGSKSIFGFCNDSGVLRTFKILNIIINIAKIAVPILLIIIGSINYGKAALSDDQEALEKTTSSLIKKVIVGLLIFFIPTIVNAVISLTGDKSSSSSSFTKCAMCFAGNKSCDSYIDDAAASEVDHKYESD